MSELAIERDSSASGLPNDNGVDVHRSTASSEHKAESLSDYDRNKIEQIHSACRTSDHASLRLLATSEGGLINDETRRHAWPFLLGCRDDSKTSESEWESLKPHRDEGQVELDVNRSFVYYPENEPEPKLNARKRQLSDLIVAVLRRHPRLYYFQGYHDIIQVFLLVLGAESADRVVARLSLLRIRDFMLPTIAGAETHLHLLPAILYVADVEVFRHLSGAKPFFALASTLTLYAHDVEDYKDIARLFDYLLASEAVVPLYLFAAIVISRKKELLEIGPDEPEMLHYTLCKLPKPLNLEKLIQRAEQLFKQHPPKSLPYRVWPRISINSVLKTTRDANALARQTLADGEAFFGKQAVELRRAEEAKQRRIRVNALIRRYRRPASVTGMAVLVAVLALYLGRSSGSDWFSAAFVLQQRLVEGVRAVLSRV